MSYRVKTVGSRREMNDFLKLPFRIYADDPNWVAPVVSEVRRTLNVQRNPYFRNASLKLFVCYNDNVPIARVSIVINRVHQEKFDVKAAFFGFFEAVDDVEAVKSLFYEVERYCCDQGIELLEGPFNPNHYSELGLQVTGFGTQPTYFQTYNPEYYPQLLEAVGFTVSKTLFTGRNEHIKDYIQRIYSDRLQPFERNGLAIRPFSLKNFDDDLERVQEVFNDAFERNWHFLPVSKEEYRFTTQFLRHVTKPELLQIVEYQGEAVGVLMCMPDINPLLKELHGRIGPLKLVRFLQGRKRLRTLLVFAVGLRKRFQRTAVHEYLFNALCQMASRYDILETTWMSYDNTLAVKAAERFGLKERKRLAIYEKTLTRQSVTDL